MGHDLSQRDRPGHGEGEEFAGGRSLGEPGADRGLLAWGVHEDRFAVPCVRVLQEQGVEDSAVEGAEMGLMLVCLTRVSSRRECDAAYINNFKLDRGKSAQSALATLPVVLPLDPRNNRQTKFFPGRPHPPIEHILLQKREEALHCRVIPSSTHMPHRPLQLIST